MVLEPIWVRQSHPATAQDGCRVRRGGIHRRDYRSAPKALRTLWRYLRQVLPRYRFGRHELLPVKRTGPALACYLAKYLTKDGDMPKGARRVRYIRAQAWRMATCRMASIGPAGRCWRAQVRRLAELCGFKSMDEIKRRFGPRWAYSLRNSLAELPGVLYPDVEAVAYHLGVSEDWFTERSAGY